MRLGDLLPGSRAAAEVLARDGATVTADSRNVAPGALFFAVAGAKADGLSFAEEAARKGAVAIVADRQPSIALSAPVVEVADVRAALELGYERTNRFATAQRDEACDDPDDE